MNHLHYFSVIIPTHKRPKMLKNALDSLCRQTISNFEVIVVIDGPSAGYENLANEYASLTLKILCIEKSRGVSSARNQGAAVASADWLIFLDDDDEFTPRCLEERLLHIKRYGESTNYFSWCNVKHVKVNSTGETEAIGYSNFKSEYPTESHLFADAFRVGAGYALSVSKTSFMNLGGFSEAYKVSEDTDFILRLLTNGNRPIVNLGIGVIVYHHHSEKLTKIMSNRSTFGVLDSLLNDHEEFLNKHFHLKITALNWAAKTHYEASAFDDGDALFKQMIQLAVLEPEYLKWCQDVALYRKLLLDTKQESESLPTCEPA